ncbi:hypothetical protein [Paracerasibacillus soli]|uniref:Uncharacterized protein n=1 Tax=Paracerasibacillus soli TaxID=480284 RepID=A0ABU5CSF4_9BACI|nr:hypothetical protein [Virgibacillus soli]MDY0409261.1 hypothetical protein [Virgibacillus soli]
MAGKLYLANVNPINAQKSKFVIVTVTATTKLFAYHLTYSVLLNINAYDEKSIFLGRKENL